MRMGLGSWVGATVLLLHLDPRPDHRRVHHRRRPARRLGLDTGGGGTVYVQRLTFAG